MGGGAVGQAGERHPDSACGDGNWKTNKDLPVAPADSSTFEGDHHWSRWCSTLMRDPALTLASLLRTPALLEASSLWLKSGRYALVPMGDSSDPVATLGAAREEVDAVLLEQGAFPPQVYQALRDQELLLPAVVIGEVTGRIEYHDAEVHLPADQLEQLPYSLDAAVSRFVRRGLLKGGGLEPGSAKDAEEHWKLANRLKDRLGYLGVYYKRDPDRFFRHLPESEREELVRSLTRTYRDLLVSYFRDPAAANQALESFVNTAFFADLPITTTVEIHMNLIDGFWKQLKLEGHKNDFLQDYRLALLDVMAHLCEMYRRSIPPDRPMTPPLDFHNLLKESV
jgi:circadian clock protein KaiA